MQCLRWFRGDELERMGIDELCSRLGCLNELIHCKLGWGLGMERTKWSKMKSITYEVPHSHMTVPCLPLSKNLLPFHQILVVKVFHDVYIRRKEKSSSQ